MILIENLSHLKNEVIINKFEFNNVKEFSKANKRYLEPVFNELKTLLEKIDL